MKGFRKAVSLALCAALAVSTVPVALAAEEEPTDPIAQPSSPSIRLEAENWIKDFSTTDAKEGTLQDVTLSGGKFLDNTKNGHIICLGEADTTGLQSMTMRMVNPRADVTFDFYLDGVQADRQVASLKTQKTDKKSDGTEDWTAYKEFSADVLPGVSAKQLTGVHTVYMTVTSSSSGGNIDYVDLIKVNPETVEHTISKNFNTDLDKTLSREIASGSFQPVEDSEGNKISSCIGSTRDGYVMAYANIPLDTLKSITITHAQEPNASVKLEIYRGSTFADATLLLSCDLDNTKNNSGNWYAFDNYRPQEFSFPETADLSGTDNLFFEITTANYQGGNYQTFTLHYANEVVKTDKGMNFADDIDISLSKTPYNINKKDIHLVESTSSGTVLAYSNIAVEGLTGISLNYAPTTNLAIEVYYGETIDTAVLVATPSLNNAQIGSENWYDSDNYRDSDVFALSLGDIVSGSNLFFKLTAGRGNFKTFTLHYAEDISSVWQYDAVNYVWGATSGDNNWIKSEDSPLIESPSPDDVFYLGRVKNLQNLQSIVVKAAMGRTYDAEYELWADLTVDFDKLTEDADKRYNHDKYKYSGNYDSVFTGGTKLGVVTVKHLNNWTCYHHAVALEQEALSDLSDGPHAIYLKTVNTGNSGCGNIDDIRFDGLQKTDFDRTSNFPQFKVQFIGKYGETFATRPVSSIDDLRYLLTGGGVEAPVIYGYRFDGWDHSIDEDALQELYGIGCMAETKTLPITARYVKDDTTPYTVTVPDGVSVLVGGEAKVLDEYNQITNLGFDTRITVEAPSDKDVLYWELNNTKFAFEENACTFYVSGNDTIGVTYKSEGEEVPTTPDVVIQRYAAPQSGGTYTFTVIAQSSIPDKENLVDGQITCGVLYSGSVNVLKNLAAGTDVDEAPYIRVVSSNHTPDKQYMTSLLNVQPNRYRYAVAYVTVGDTTYYSSQYIKLTTPANASDEATLDEKPFIYTNAQQEG